MILKLYAAAFLSFTALLSCDSSNSNDYIDKSLIPPAAENKAVQAADTTPAIQTPAQITTVQPNNTVTTVSPGNPAPLNITPPPVVTSTPQPATQVTAPGMNPPHGQPGHRCDISVGAPLNSKPAQPAAANISTSQPAVTQSVQQANTQATAPGMNPPHGQPGHRCDITVGAPLNSKPAQNAKSTQPVISIQKPDSAKNK